MQRRNLSEAFSLPTSYIDRDGRLRLHLQQHEAVIRISVALIGGTPNLATNQKYNGLYIRHHVRVSLRYKSTE